MSKYICVNKEKDTALYYHKDIGKKRIYRQSYPLTMWENLKIWDFKSLKGAQKLCDDINSRQGTQFEPMEILK